MIWVRGVEYGTAADLAARLGPDVTEAMVRNWQQRDGLTRHRIAGRVCTGEGCGCGMPVRVKGVGHIWDASHPLATTTNVQPVS